MRIIGRLMITFVMAIFLASCVEKDIAEEIKQCWQELMEYEVKFMEVGKRIVELEKKDEKIYNELIAIGNSDQDKLAELVTKAKELLQEREVLFGDEKKMLAQSEQKWNQLKSLIDSLDNIAEKEKYDQIIEVMRVRYDLYDEIIQQYPLAIELTEKLYTSLGEEPVNQNELIIILRELNALYLKVDRSYDAFNLQTEKFNHIKDRLFD